MVQLLLFLRTSFPAPLARPHRAQAALAQSLLELHAPPAHYQ